MVLPGSERFGGRSRVRKGAQFGRSCRSCSLEEYSVPLSLVLKFGMNCWNFRFHVEPITGVSVIMKTAATGIFFIFLMALSPALAQEAQYWGDRKDELTSGPEYQASKLECRSLRNLSPPASDQVNGARRAALAGCDAEKLYYGIGVPAQPEKARDCAMLKSRDGGDPFGGAALLSMIYANGRGAAKDLDLAIHFACYIEGAPAEMAGRVEHLMKIRAGQAPGKEFSVCDDATSGMLTGFCVAHDERIAKVALEGRVDSMLTGMSGAQKAAFFRLRSAMNDYAEKSASNEVDLTGSMRGVFFSQRRDEVRSAWSKLLKAMENGEAVHPKAGLASSDKELNRVYRRIMSKPMPYSDMSGAVTRDGIRIAERAWINYRDAWVAYAKARHPKVDAMALKAKLTELRTEFLKSLVD